MKFAEKINILNALYEGYYEALYNSTELYDYSSAVDAVEAGLEIPAIRKAFVALEKRREDAITSDREYAAFLMAWCDAEKVIKDLEREERKMAKARRHYREKYGDFLGDVLYLETLKAQEA